MTTRIKTEAGKVSGNMLAVTGQTSPDPKELGWICYLDWTHGLKRKTGRALGQLGTYRMKRDDVGAETTGF